MTSQSATKFADMSPADIVIQQHNIGTEIVSGLAEYIAQNGTEFSAAGIIVFAIGYVIRRVLRAKVSK